jgi:hypothetical protein
MASRWNGRDAVELERRRRLLILRAALERSALQGATEDMQMATDRIVRVGGIVVTLVRRFWLPLGVLAAAGLFNRLGPMLWVARTGLAIWQTARLVRAGRR